MYEYITPEKVKISRGIKQSDKQKKKKNRTQNSLEQISFLIGLQDV